jgi:predicted GH43/DUF377 family glycosyl hydrolase
MGERPGAGPYGSVRTGIRLRSDPDRVLLRPFLPGAGIASDVEDRVVSVLQRILALPESEVTATLEATRSMFAGRHLDLDGTLERHFGEVATALGTAADGLSPARRLLIGAYFTHEYAIEAAALTNPSLVPAPDQGGLPRGHRRFVMSARAIGEGHLSSITFRSGSIDEHGAVLLDPATRLVTSGMHQHATYEGPAFRAKLLELGVLHDIVEVLLESMPPRFTAEELEGSLATIEARGVDPALAFETTRIVGWIAASNYAVVFSEGSRLSERVIFPSGPAESQGMEDARFVRFEGDGGAITYYATYTAFDGFGVQPQLIETTDFLSFRIATLNGPEATNKGLALFPRRIAGHFAVLSRQDNERNFVMFSDDVRTWAKAVPIQSPSRPWELIQLGNCGSPIETDAGWLVLTHGVGPLRRYAIGAILLDRDDPSRLIGRLEEPLVTPTDEEREGYVPNVVYSCGGMLHGGQLVLPYGFADQGIGILTVPLDHLLSSMT